MRFIVQPSALTGGHVVVPGDKSISHRALMLGAIANGSSAISGFLGGHDCLCTMAALQQLGIAIEYDGKTNVLIHGRGMHGLSAPAGDLDMGNSGTAMRLFAGLLAAQDFESRLTGDASLSARPMGRVIDPLTAMGAVIGSSEGRPPLTIRGNPQLRAIEYATPVASAQVKSAILLAGLYANGRTRVIEPAITRDHTERMLQSMGVTIAIGEHSAALQGGQALAAASIDVPADLSSAAFPMVATLLSDNASLTLAKVGVNPTRTGVLQILRQMGARIELDNERQLGAEPVADITVHSSRLQGIDVDPGLVSLAIDEFPLLFVAAACASGQTRFSGLAELRVKESDRIAAMARGLLEMGIDVEETADGAVISGARPDGGTVESFGDHRIAMAFAVCASVASAPVTILDTEPVMTSFPGFVETMRGCGLDIEQREDAGT